MRKTALVMTSLFLVLVVGCNGSKVQPTPTVVPPSPTSALVMTSPTPFVTPVPTGPAACRVAPMEFPEVSGIPGVREDDHVEGNINGSIILIEYADFQ